MVGITIQEEKSSSDSTIPFLSPKKSSRKPKDMKTTIIFGLIGILFVLMFLGYWKMSTGFEWIQHNLPTTSTSTTTTTSITTTSKQEEFEPKSCDDVDDVVTWLKCEKSRDRKNSKEGGIFAFGFVGFIVACACICGCCEAMCCPKEKDERTRNSTYDTYVVLD